MGYKFRSTISISFLFGMVFALVLLIDNLAFGATTELYVMLIFVCGIIFIQYLISPLIINWIFAIDWIEYHALEEHDPHIARLIQQVCEKYNIPLPKFGVIHGGTPNAFTFGWSRKTAKLVITEGILNLLNKNEQRAVVAHELGHIQHNDFIVMTFVSAIPVLFYSIFRILVESFKYDKEIAGNSDDAAPAVGAYMAGKAIIATVSFIMYIVGFFLSLFISRLREYYADEFSAKETEDPNSLATALVKIAYGILAEPKEVVGKRKTDRSQFAQALGIFDKNSAKQLAYASTNGKGEIDENLIAKACAWDLYQPWAKLSEVLSTHPLPAKRIKELSYLSFREFKKTPAIDLSSSKTEFEKQMGKSGIDEFLTELLIWFLPKILFWTWILIGVGLIIGDFDFTSFSPVFNSIGSFLVFSLVIAGIFQLLQNSFKYNGDFSEHNITNLIGTIRVSPIRPVPTITKGTIIGRGVPGLFYSEDLVIQDEYGIMYIDYDFGFGLLNFLFGIFKIEKLKDKPIEVVGWYRRGPTPYIQVHRIKVLDGSGTVYGNYKKALWNFISIFLISLGLFLWFFITF